MLMEPLYFDIMFSEGEAGRSTINISIYPYIITSHLSCTREKIYIMIQDAFSVELNCSIHEEKEKETIYALMLSFRPSLDDK